MWIELESKIQCEDSNSDIIFCKYQLDNLNKFGLFDEWICYKIIQNKKKYN